VAKIGMVPAGGDVESGRAFLADEHARMAALTREENIRRSRNLGVLSSPRLTANAYAMACETALRLRAVPP
jgi:hypothetical protein